MKMRTITLNRHSPPRSGGRNRFLLLLVWLNLAAHLTAAQTTHISGELKQWHKVTLTLDGPLAHERDGNGGFPAAEAPTGAQAGRQESRPSNPFTDYRMTVTFTHESGTPSYQVPGYFAADGNAANTSADSGNQWRAHLSPDKQKGTARPGEATPTGLKTWQPHVRDWRPGDPTWKDGQGKGLIGALNYLAGKGCNVFSFLTYNAGGDGDDVWPFRERDDKLHYDCSKLDQWQMVFDHATQLGLYCHFKTQETENDDLKGPAGGAIDLDLTSANGIFRVKWFNPRTGGGLQDGPVKQVQGGTRVALGQPPSDSHLD